MKQLSTKSLLFFILLALTMQSCKKDKDQVELPPAVLNSPELITSLVIQFKDSANTNNVTRAEYRDPDGPGGNAAIKFDTIQLKINTTYFVELIVLDETKNPMDTVSNEIWEERNDHQFFFKHTNTSIVTTYLDKDTNGYPVGLSTKWRTNSSQTGSSNIILKHQVNLKNGTEAPGETDIDVNFHTKIK